MKSNQYTAEGTIEQLGMVAQGMQRRWWGRHAARLVVVVFASMLVVGVAQIVFG